MVIYDRRKGFNILLLPNAFFVVLSPSDRKYSVEYKGLLEAWKAIDDDSIVWAGQLKDSQEIL